MIIDAIDYTLQQMVEQLVSCWEKNSAYIALIHDVCLTPEKITSDDNSMLIDLVGFQELSRCSTQGECYLSILHVCIHQNVNKNSYYGFEILK